MEEAFSDLLSRILNRDGDGIVQVLSLSDGWDTGILRVELRDGRKFSVHFHLAE